MPRGVCTPCRERVDFRLEHARLGYFSSRLVDIASETKRPREDQNSSKGRRICGARLPQEFDRLIQMPEKEMALTERRIIGDNRRVVWAKPDRFLDIGNCLLRFPHLYQGYSKIPKCNRMISVQGNRRFQLDPRFAQPVLKSTEDPQTYMRSRIVRIILENFSE
jgi:hypothetical protein